jgi:hypothetical protein
MTRPEFEARKAAAVARLNDDWERAWREKLHVKLRHGADFAGGAPGDLIIEHSERSRTGGEGSKTY